MLTTTLQTARRTLARSFDDLAVHGITSVTATTVTAFSLIDATSTASPDRFDGAYVYAVDTRELRRVQPAGYAPGAGTLTVTAPWTILPTGGQIEITRLLPATSDQIPSEEQSWNECLRRSCARLLIPDRVPLFITPTEQYSLATYPWLDRPERLVRVTEPPATGFTQVSADWRGWRIVFVGGVMFLDFRVPFTATVGNLILDVLRPADTWISGSETVPGIGPTLDTQTIPVGVDELVVLGTLEAATALMSRTPGRPGQWEGRYKEAREQAERLYHFDGAFYAPKSAATTAGGVT